MKVASARMIRDALGEDGTLFIDHSETFRSLDSGLEPAEPPQAFACQRKGRAAS